MQVHEEGQHESKQWRACKHACTIHPRADLRSMHT
jgi:hypothetical protein